MKFTPGSGYNGPIVVNGVRFNVGAGGNLVTGPATNNRRAAASNRAGTSPVPSPLFQSVDQLIVSLDATFDLLPNQAAWNATAAANAGNWSLCANCQPDYAGKKYFRQINFNRAQIGLPLLTDPSGVVSNVGDADYTVQCWKGPVGGPAYAEWFGPSATQKWTEVAQLGMGLGNFAWTVDTSWVNNVQLSGAAVSTALALASACGINVDNPVAQIVEIGACTYDSTGVPGLPDSIIIDFRP